MKDLLFSVSELSPFFSFRPSGGHDVRKSGIAGNGMRTYSCLRGQLRGFHWHKLGCKAACNALPECR